MNMVLHIYLTLRRGPDEMLLGMAVNGGQQTPLSAWADFVDGNVCLRTVRLAAAPALHVLSWH